MKSICDAPPRPRDLFFYIRRVLSIMICSYLVMVSRLVHVMLRSRNVISSVMRLSYICYAVFLVLWFYTAFFIQPKNPNWNETHKLLLYSATSVVTLGGLLWIIALWPVFHIWTIPLGFVVLVLFFDIIALIPSRSKKVKH